MDNNPVPGYRFASYEQGYGDMLARADWRHGPPNPVGRQDGDDHVRSVQRRHRRTVEVAPRTVLRRQEEAAEALGFLPMVASEIEFYLFQDTYDEAHAKGYRDLRPHSPWLEDYHILQTTKDEYILGAIRRGLEAAGVPVEFSKGEAGRGQHEMNLDYTTAVEMADRNSVYKTAAKEIAHSNGRSVSFMAKYDFNDTGSSCHVHSSLWSLDGKKAAVRRSSRAARDERDVPALPRRPDRHRPGVQPAVGADGQQLQALPARVMGADRDRLGSRQPHARLPQGRARQGHLASSAASPAATPTATSRSPVRSPAVCTGSATSSTARRAVRRQRLRGAPTSVAFRGTSPTRSHCGRARRSPRSASATTCTTTSSTMAKAEWLAFEPVGHRLGVAPLLGAHLAQPQWSVSRPPGCLGTLH